MEIKTTRFGNVQVSTDDVIQFPEGIIGFPHLNQFVLLDDPTDEIFAWLQSCSVPEIAFPVLEPELFMPAFKANLTKRELEVLSLENMQNARVFCIITIPNDPTLMTANLKAPVVINARAKIARQCVQQDNDLSIREPIFARLQQRVVQAPQASVKSQAADWGLAISLPEMGAAKGAEKAIQK